MSRSLLAGLLLGLSLAGRPASVGSQAANALDPAGVERVFEQAAQLPRLQALVIARNGRIVAERRLRGASLDSPVNIKSISKSIISALVGIAIAQGKLTGADQPIAPFFAKYL
jgi:CubicO group peptidase (beta-lactamase class C family)